MRVIQLGYLLPLLVTKKNKIGIWMEWQIPMKRVSLTYIVSIIATIIAVVVCDLPSFDIKHVSYLIKYKFIYYSCKCCLIKWYFQLEQLLFSNIVNNILTELEDNISCCFSYRLTSLS